MFHGYIDESGSSESRLFTLPCVVSHGSTWYWLENEWVNCLEKTNKSLAGQGRQKLSRYHASDCSNLKNEFLGWGKRVGHP
jgi:hypothetical protein